MGGVRPESAKLQFLSRHPLDSTDQTKSGTSHARDFGNAIPGDSLPMSVVPTMRVSTAVVSTMRVSAAVMSTVAISGVIITATVPPVVIAVMTMAVVISTIISDTNSESDRGIGVRIGIPVPRIIVGIRTVVRIRIIIGDAGTWHIDDRWRS